MELRHRRFSATAVLLVALVLDAVAASCPGGTTPLAAFVGTAQSSAAPELRDGQASAPLRVRVPLAYVPWLRTRLQRLPADVAAAVIGGGGGDGGAGGLDGTNSTAGGADASDVSGTGDAAVTLHIVAVAGGNGTTALAAVAPAPPAAADAPAQRVSSTAVVAGASLARAAAVAAAVAAVDDGNTADAWLVPAHELAGLAASGAAADVGRLLRADRASGWWDVAPQFREAMALYGGAVAAVPLGAGPLIMFVRSDVLAAAGPPGPPQSWQALLAFAQQYGSVRRPQDPPHALCLPAGPDCTRLHLLHAVWASVAQTRGRRQGMYFDPWTGAPRLDTAALRYALQLLANLTAWAAPQPAVGGPGCGVGGLAAESGGEGFAGGQCAIVLDVSTTLLQALAATSATTAGGAAAAAPPFLAHVVVRPAPGSEVVWDNTTDTLLPCTAGAGGGKTALCAAGEPLDLPPPPPRRQPLPPLSASHPSPPSGQRRRLRSRNLQAQKPAVVAGDVGLGAGATAAPGQPLLVNRSPQLTAVSLTGAISARATPLAQLRAYLLLTHLAAPSVEVAAAGADSGGGSSSSGGSSSGGGEAGLPPIRTSQFLGATSNGAGSALSTPAGATAELAALAAEAVRVTAGEVQHANAGWQESLPAMAAIRCDGGSSSSAGGGVRLALPIALPCAVVVVLAALALLLQRRRLTLLGHVVSRLMPHTPRWSARAPAASPDMCLVVTDIESSTVLWEALPAAVMDRAVGLHHACLRRALVKNQGYESCTEPLGQADGWSRPWESPFEVALQAALNASLQQMAEQVASAMPGAATATAPALGEEDTAPLIVLDMGQDDALETDVRATTDDTSSQLFVMSDTEPFVDGAAGGAAAPGGLLAPQPEYPRLVSAARCVPHTGAASHAAPCATSAMATTTAGSDSDMATAPTRDRPTRGGATAGGLSRTSAAGFVRSGSSAVQSAGGGVARPAARAAGFRKCSDGSGVLPSHHDVAAAGVEPLRQPSYPQQTLGLEIVPQRLQEPRTVSVRAIPIASLAQAGISGGLLAADGAAALGSSGSGSDPRPSASGHLHRRRLSIDIPRHQLIEPPEGYAGEDATTQYDAPPDQTGQPLPPMPTLLPPCLAGTVGPGAAVAAVAAASAAAAAAAAAAASLLSAGQGRGGVSCSRSTTLGQWIVQLVSSTAGAATLARGLCAPTAFTATAEDLGEAGASTPPAPYKQRGRLLRTRSAKAGPRADGLTAVTRRSQSGDAVARARGPSRTEAGAASGPHGPGRSVSGGPAAAGQQPGQACVFRGLRVRVGVSLGPTNPAEVSHNAASQRTVYGGAAAVLAKAVSDAAHGGMVTLTGDVFARLYSLSTSASGGAPKLPPHVAVRAGRYALSGGLAGDGGMDLLLAWPEALTARMALLPPPRCSARALGCSVYDAPVAEAAVAKLHLPHLGALMAADEAAARAGLALVVEVAAREAAACGGYLAVSAAPDAPTRQLMPNMVNESVALAAAFANALDAARWALAVQECLASPDCPWPPALLAHELCCEATLPLLDAGELATAAATAAAASLAATASAAGGAREGPLSRATTNGGVYGSLPLPLPQSPSHTPTRRGLAALHSLKLASWRSNGSAAQQAPAQAGSLPSGPLPSPMPPRGQPGSPPVLVNHSAELLPYLRLPPQARYHSHNSSSNGSHPQHYHQHPQPPSFPFQPPPPPPPHLPHLQPQYRRASRSDFGYASMPTGPDAFDGTGTERAAQRPSRSLFRASIPNAGFAAPALPSPPSMRGVEGVAGVAGASSSGAARSVHLHVHGAAFARPQGDQAHQSGGSAGAGSGEGADAVELLRASSVLSAAGGLAESSTSTPRLHITGAGCNGAAFGALLEARGAAAAGDDDEADCSPRSATPGPVASLSMVPAFYEPELDGGAAAVGGSGGVGSGGQSSSMAGSLRGSMRGGARAGRHSLLLFPPSPRSAATVPVSSTAVSSTQLAPDAEQRGPPPPGHHRASLRGRRLSFLGPGARAPASIAAASSATSSRLVADAGAASSIADMGAASPQRSATVTSTGSTPSPQHNGGALQLFYASDIAAVPAPGKRAVGPTQQDFASGSPHSSTPGVASSMPLPLQRDPAQQLLGAAAAATARLATRATSSHGGVFASAGAGFQRDSSATDTGAGAVAVPQRQPQVGSLGCGAPAAFAAAPGGSVTARAPAAALAAGGSGSGGAGQSPHGVSMASYLNQAIVAAQLGGSYGAGSAGSNDGSSAAVPGDAGGRRLLSAYPASSPELPLSPSAGTSPVHAAPPPLPPLPPMPPLPLTAPLWPAAHGYESAGGSSGRRLRHQPYSAAGAGSSATSATTRHDSHGPGSATAAMASAAAVAAAAAAAAAAAVALSPFRSQQAAMAPGSPHAAASCALPTKRNVMAASTSFLRRVNQDLASRLRRKSRVMSSTGAAPAMPAGGYLQRAPGRAGPAPEGGIGTALRVHGAGGGGDMRLWSTAPAPPLSVPEDGVAQAFGALRTAATGEWDFQATARASSVVGGMGGGTTCPLPAAADLRSGTTTQAASATSIGAHGHLRPASMPGAGDWGFSWTSAPAAGAAPADVPAAIALGALTGVGLELEEEWAVRARGFRLQFGIDVGRVDWHISAASGWLTYTGEVPRKARQLAVKAARPGQVLLSRRAAAQLAELQLPQAAAAAAAAAALGVTLAGGAAASRLPPAAPAAAAAGPAACGGYGTGGLGVGTAALMAAAVHWTGTGTEGHRASATSIDPNAPRPSITAVAPQPQQPQEPPPPPPLPRPVAVVAVRRRAMSLASNTLSVVCKLADTWQAALSSSLAMAQQLQQQQHGAPAAAGGGAAPASPSWRGRMTPLPSTPMEPRSPMAHTRMPRNASAPAVVPPPPPSPDGAALAVQLLPGAPPPLRPLSLGTPSTSLSRSLQRAAAAAAATTDGRATWVCRPGSSMQSSQVASPLQCSPAASAPPSNRDSREADDQRARPQPGGTTASAASSMYGGGAAVAAASSLYSSSKGASQDGAAGVVGGPGRLLRPPSALPSSSGRTQPNAEVLAGSLPAGTPTATWFAPQQTPPPGPFDAAVAPAWTPSAAPSQPPSHRPTAVGAPSSLVAGPATSANVPNGASGARAAVPGNSFSNASDALALPKGALLTELLTSDTLPRRSAGAAVSTARSRRMPLVQGWDSSCNLASLGAAGSTVAATMASAAAATDAADGRRPAAGAMVGLGASVALAFRCAKQLAAKLAGGSSRGSGRQDAQGAAGGHFAQASEPTPNEAVPNGQAVFEGGGAAVGDTGRQQLSSAASRTLQPLPTQPPRSSSDLPSPLWALMVPSQQQQQQQQPAEQHLMPGAPSGAGRSVSGSSAGAAAACGPNGNARRAAEPSIIGSVVPDIAVAATPAHDASEMARANGCSTHDSTAVRGGCTLFSRLSAPVAGGTNGAGRSRSAAAALAGATGGWRPLSSPAAETLLRSARLQHGQAADLSDGGLAAVAPAPARGAALALSMCTEVDSARWTEVDTLLNSGNECAGTGDAGNVQAAADAPIEQAPRQGPAPGPPLSSTSAMATSVRAAAAHATPSWRLMKGAAAALLHVDSPVANNSCSIAFDAAAISPVDTPTLSREHSVTAGGRVQGGAASAGPPASGCAGGTLMGAALPRASRNPDLVLARIRVRLGSGTAAAAIPTIGDFVSPMVRDGESPSVTQLLLGRAPAASAVAFIGSPAAGGRPPRPAGGSKRSSASVSLGYGSRGGSLRTVGSSAGSSSRSSASQLHSLSPVRLAGSGGAGAAAPVALPAAAVHWCYQQLAMGTGGAAPRASTGSSGMVPTGAVSTGSSGGGGMEHVAGRAAVMAASVRAGPGGTRVSSLSHLIPASGSEQHFLTPQELLLLGSGGSGSTAGGRAILHASACSADASDSHPAGAEAAEAGGGPPAGIATCGGRFHLITTTISDVSYMLDSGRGASAAAEGDEGKAAAAEGVAGCCMGTVVIADGSTGRIPERRHLDEGSGSATASAEVDDSGSGKGAGSAGSAGSISLSLRSRLAGQAVSGVASCGGLPTAGDCIVTLGGGMCDAGGAAALLAAGGLSSLGASASGEGTCDFHSFEVLLSLQPVRLPLAAADVETAPRQVLGPGPAATRSLVTGALAAGTTAPAAELGTGQLSSGAAAPAAL
ncbi:hypothetical protein HXX76_002760 [Chlamydomonas incerta]|uniref:Guanylate cyclase domain-containing protein n=1 Tax=Chlamydomonas incerta TaxID=51695 RepID=A0A835W6T4_CHLIN|nr:hypothetical protein HXX76_002760 [Chlamydomonas incerta]|eukprot:KAG2442677.1 hypothetical protein HXX76_002760 [Chlamydomonas incerta]